MKTDVYTKTVLTVIAIFLGLNFLKEVEIIPTAKANTATTAQAPQPIATQTAPVDVNITHMAGVPLTKYLDISRYPNDYQQEINIYGGIPIKIYKNWDK